MRTCAKQNLTWIENHT